MRSANAKYRERRSRYRRALGTTFTWWLALARLEPARAYHDFAEVYVVFERGR